MQRNSVRNATAWIRINVCRGILNSCGHLADVAVPPYFHLNFDDREILLLL